MARRRFVLLVILLIGSFALAENSLNSQAREIATFVTDFIKPTEWDNQDYWRDHWSIATVSFDLNNDGLCDALVCTPDQQSSRRLGWLPVCRVADGEMQIEYDLENAECVFCYQSAFCIATISNDVRVLVGLDAYVEKYESRKRVWNKTGDVLIKADSRGRIKTAVLIDGVEGLLRESEFCRLEHVSPLWHVGYRLEMKHKDKSQRSVAAMSSRHEYHATKSLPFRIDWSDGASSCFTLDDSKKSFSSVREALVGGRIKRIEKLPRMVCELENVTASTAEPAPGPKCFIQNEPTESTSSDKPSKKIIRHKVRDDEDVTGLSILYDTPSNEIRHRNKLKRDEDVRPGQIVELEVDYDFVDSH